jgi:hypothetical protein
VIIVRCSVAPPTWRSLLAWPEAFGHAQISRKMLYLVRLTRPLVMKRD